MRSIFLSSNASTRIQAHANAHFNRTIMVGTSLQFHIRICSPSLIMLHDNYCSCTCMIIEWYDESESKHAMWWLKIFLFSTVRHTAQCSSSLKRWERVKWELEKAKNKREEAQVWYVIGILLLYTHTNTCMCAHTPVLGTHETGFRQFSINEPIYCFAIYLYHRYIEY